MTLLKLYLIASVSRASSDAGDDQPAADVLSCKVTVPATLDPTIIRRTTPAPVFSKDPVAVLNHVKELRHLAGCLGKHRDQRVSLAVGAVLPRCLPSPCSYRR